MKLKICGMREGNNLADIAGLGPDLLGFIFYDKSRRYMRDTLAPADLHRLPASIGRVGVFVDAELADVAATARAYGLDYVQLHGHETPAYCQQVQALGMRVIKAFSMDKEFDFNCLSTYTPYCELFLFDTKGEQPGGNGAAFDWQLVRQYQGPTPFLLAGGLGPANLAALQQFGHLYLHGFDFNSQLETAPGHKDVARTRQVLAHLRQPTA